jgi:hypothetical protein
MARSYGESSEVAIVRNFAGAVIDREKWKTIQTRLPWQIGESGLQSGRSVVPCAMVSHDPLGPLHLFGKETFHENI